MINTVKIGPLSNLTAEYSLTETLSLTNSSWNYFGFASFYGVSLDITQGTGATVGLGADDSIYQPSFSITVKPSEYSIHKFTEQRVSTILGGLASAGGVSSAIIAIQALLFGFRPNSPWGVVQRWTFGRPHRSLREQLRDRFTTNNNPVPMVTRVHDDYHLLPTSSNSTAFEMALLNQGEYSQKVLLKFRKWKTECS